MELQSARPQNEILKATVLLECVLADFGSSCQYLGLRFAQCAGRTSQFWHKLCPALRASRTQTLGSCALRRNHGYHAYRNTRHRTQETFMTQDQTQKRNECERCCFCCCAASACCCCCCCYCCTAAASHQVEAPCANLDPSG